MSKKKPLYPLEQVLEIKIRRVKEAEKVVQEKQKILEQEQEKYDRYYQAWKKVDEHHQDKLEQLREGLDQGIQPHEIDQTKKYLKSVKEKRLEEQRKMDRQKKQVELAEQRLEDAKALLKEKRLEVDKLEMHKEQWTHQEVLKMRKEEAKKLDEIGSVIYERHRMKELKDKKKKEKS